MVEKERINYGRQKGMEGITYPSHLALPNSLLYSSVGYVIFHDMSGYYK